MCLNQQVRGLIPLAEIDRPLAGIDPFPASVVCIRSVMKWAGRFGTTNPSKLDCGFREFYVSVVAAA